MKTKSIQPEELRMKSSDFDAIMSKAFQVAPKATAKKKRKRK